jgi:hypothetical protein
MQRVGDLAVMAHTWVARVYGCGKICNWRNLDRRTITTREVTVPKLAK